MIKFKDFVRFEEVTTFEKLYALAKKRTEEKEREAICRCGGKQYDN